MQVRGRVVIFGSGLRGRSLVPEAELLATTGEHVSLETLQTKHAAVEIQHTRVSLGVKAIPVAYSAC